MTTKTLTKKEKYTEILELATGKRILVVGDLMLDHYIHGDASRLSPESPVPVLQHRRETHTLGGAGNVAANLASLGVTTDMIALTGDDHPGKTLRDLLETRYISTNHVLIEKARQTTVKTRYLAGNQQLLRMDREETGPLNPESEGAVILAVKNAVAACDLVIVSDYGKGLLTDNILQAVIFEAGQKNIPVLVDPKGHDFGRYRGADVITPNRSELSSATRGMPVNSDNEIIAAARKVIKDHGINTVIATRSQDGMTIVSRAGDVYHLQTAALEVFDVSGAGDTVIATLGAALAAGAELKDAASLANTSAGIVVAKSGTATVTAAEIKAPLSYSLTNLTAPILDRHDATGLVTEWKDQGLTVGFTNGCFDILHDGHVRYLAAARGHCDRLVIGLNTDESVARLKGPERPVNPLSARAEVLAALSVVDMVIPFGDKAIEQDKAINMIELLKPAVYFKGGDYRETDIPEAPAVKKFGGLVRIMPHQAGRSTTDTIEKIRKPGS